jgi:hypothetical protein
VLSNRRSIFVFIISFRLFRTRTLKSILNRALPIRASAAFVSRDPLQYRGANLGHPHAGLQFSLQFLPQIVLVHSVYHTHSV